MIDLTPFCADSDDPRDYLHRPIRYNGHVYGTNGHLMVRVHDDGRDAGDKPDQMNIDRAWPENWPTDWRFIVGAIPGYEDIECYWCEEGVAVCDLGHKHDCPSCNGMGRREEVMCVGLLDIAASDKYVAKVNALPGAQWAAGKNAQFQVLCARGNGWEGVLMPMRGKVERTVEVRHAKLEKSDG